MEISTTFETLYRKDWQEIAWNKEVCGTLRLFLKIYM
jgi:hypothetical protein